MVVDRLGLVAEGIESRWAMKASVRLVGYMDWRLGSDWSFRLKFQVGADHAMGSRDENIPSRKETTPE